MEKKYYKCKRAQFLDILYQEHFSMIAAMEATNITINKFEEWLEKYPWFKEKINEAKLMKEIYIEEKLFELIRSGDARSILFYLQNQNSEYKKETINDRLQPGQYIFTLPPSMKKN